VSRPPNLLVLLSDQQRWDTLNCYGQPVETSPNLDRLAKAGVRFEHAFSCQPVCGPVRACLQTGKYATEVGCHVNNRRLPASETTLAHRLAAAGYETAYIGKWHLASCGPRGGPDDFQQRAVPPDRRGGYDYWLAADVLEHTSHGYDGHMFDAQGRQRDFPPGQFRVDVETDWVLEYLRSRTSDKPFFLFVSYLEPHQQNDHGHVEGPTDSKERFADFMPPSDLIDTDGEWRQEYPDYLGCVHSLDRNVGRIFDELTRLGLASETLLLYTSDHGCHFRTRTRTHKHSCHESSIRVPLIAHGPGFEGGKVVSQLVSLIDLPPTLLAAAGIETPAEMRGRPVQQLLVGPREDWPGEVFVQVSGSQCGRALRTSRWKYSARAPDKSGGDPCSEVYVDDLLYDLQADPHERNNLVGQPGYEKIARSLRDRLRKRIVQAGEREPVIRSAWA